MNKEFNILDYKIIDNGYYLELYTKNTDKFDNAYYNHIGDFRYKNKLNGANSFNSSMAVILNSSSPYEENTFGKLLKELLEENEQLKFHNKVDKVLSDE